MVLHWIKKINSFIKKTHTVITLIWTWTELNPMLSHVRVFSVFQRDVFNNFNWASPPGLNQSVPDYFYSTFSYLNCLCLLNLVINVLLKLIHFSLIFMQLFTETQILIRDWTYIAFLLIIECYINSLSHILCL